MMVWLMPSMISGMASGTFTFQSVWRFVQPDMVAASMRCPGTFRTPKMVYRMAGTETDSTTAKITAVSETEKNMMAGSR